MVMLLAMGAKESYHDVFCVTMVDLRLPWKKTATDEGHTSSLVFNANAHRWHRTFPWIFIIFVGAK